MGWKGGPVLRNAHPDRSPAAPSDVFRYQGARELLAGVLLYAQEACVLPLVERRAYMCACVCVWGGVVHTHTHTQTHTHTHTHTHRERERWRKSHAAVVLCFVGVGVCVCVNVFVCVSAYNI